MLVAPSVALFGLAALTEIVVLVGFRPTATDLIAAAICLTGVALIESRRART